MKSRLIKAICCTLIVSLFLNCFSVSYAEEDEAQQLYDRGITLLMSDDSTAEDVTAGIDDLLEAAQMGHSDAAYMLGLFFEYGYFVKQDDSMALYWYSQCMYSNLDALYKIGYFAEYGLGMEQDPEFAISVYEIAAQFGHTEATKALAYLYFQDLNDPQKAADAKELFEQAAQAGDTEAMERVGWCYEYGVGTERDYEKAGEWFAKSLEMTDGLAYYGKEPAIIFSLLKMNLGDQSLSETFCKGFYEAIYVRKHQITRNTTNDGHIEMVLASLYPTLHADRRILAARACIDWMYEQEPELKELTDQMGYSQGNIPYERSAVADIFFSVGFQAFDDRDYLMAESNYKKCIEIDPADKDARFELAETYIATGRFENAKQELHDLIPYVRNDQDKSQYYRRTGFIAIDEMDYELGGACMLYSQYFEQTEKALNELLYIQSLTGVYPSYDLTQIVRILQDNGIHIWDVKE